MYRHLALSFAVGLKPGRRVDAETLWAPRPEGMLLWLHAGSSPDLAALLHLIPRLEALEPAPAILLTLQEGLGCPGALPNNVLLQQAPQENVAQTTAFVQHFKPDLGLVCGPPLRPALHWTMSREGIPVTLVNTNIAEIDPPGFRLQRAATQALAQCFTQIICKDDIAARRLKRLRGEMAPAISLGRLEEGGAVPEIDPDMAEELRTEISGRPVWFAAQTRAGEEPMIAEAQRQMKRYSHRLLCVLSPAELERGPDLAEHLRDQGWNVALRSASEPLTEDVQMVVADAEEEVSVWYRLAPITFVGSSLVPGYGGHDPFPAATLGSALLYGPNVGNYLDSYSRLVNAGGARIVKDASSLAQGLQLLLAPDKAAAQAHAAWDVASRGAKVTDKVLEIFQEQLDEKAF
ncbi:3-deoxy-D-manno-octulosonic acid transferase [Donghicola sp. XS_ASV15]|uniref:3-deoxy-D-manno-octulosonic acid transferase n=1 Tax=Donghicola sp. XS_ASV15 TaxID=3241295 RepID=UPI0035198B07